MQGKARRAYGRVPVCHPMWGTIIFGSNVREYQNFRVIPVEGSVNNTKPSGKWSNHFAGMRARDHWTDVVVSRRS